MPRGSHQRLTNPIQHYFGGYHEVRLKLGVETLRFKRNHWKDFNNVKSEFEDLIKELGCFPNTSDIQLHKPYLLSAVNLYYGSVDQVRTLMGYVKSSISSLERNLKIILDSLVDSDKFVDNQRKDLLKYNLDLKNPDTGLYLEIDRFYFDTRIAIEIQGIQQYKSGGDRSFWRFKKGRQSGQMAFSML